MRCFYVLKKWSSAKLSLNRGLSLNKVSLNRDCTVCRSCKRFQQLLKWRNRKMQFDEPTKKVARNILVTVNRHIWFAVYRLSCFTLSLKLLSCWFTQLCIWVHEFRIVKKYSIFFQDQYVRSMAHGFTLTLLMLAMPSYAQKTNILWKELNMPCRLIQTPTNGC